ncbi:MAG: imidazole glycerol phosphate synthase subunit HisH [Enhydrobacter sp.]|nr:MAG: imidazole glycerol phosphate synthase subunit HisH [Enhydrobacter sp.]
MTLVVVKLTKRPRQSHWMLLIVDYGMGNVSAIRNMLSRIGVADVVISGDPAQCATADKIILPGVGAFDAAVRNVEERGLRGPLVEAARQRRVPMLGICLGMQLLAEGSEEGGLPGLGLIAGVVKRFDSAAFASRQRVPHMGWNDVTVVRPHRLFEGRGDELRFYFVHSYHFVCRDRGDVIGETDYGYRFDSAIAHDNVAGVQFHPEKSHQFGKRLLANFAKAT